MPQSFSHDSPINRLRGGIVIAEPFFRVCMCRRVRQFLRFKCAVCMWVRVFMYLSTPCMCVCVHMRLSVCRLERLWRVGFMSQQVTDDQINWSRPPAGLAAGTRTLQVPQNGATAAALWPSPLKKKRGKKQWHTHTCSVGSYHSHHLNADYLNLWLALLNCFCRFFFLFSTTTWKLLCWNPSTAVTDEQKVVS